MTEKAGVSEQKGEREMTTVYLVRHNEPDRSVEDDLLQPLTARGREQIAQVTEYLKDKKITAIYSSDCRRTLETISGFSEYSGLPVHPDSRLREGILGCPREENPIHTKLQWEDHTYRLPRGESLCQVQERMREAIDEIVRNNRGGCIAVSTHCTAICALLNSLDPAFDWEQAKAVKRVWPWIVRLEYDADGMFKEYTEMVR